MHSGTLNSKGPGGGGGDRDSSLKSGQKDTHVLLIISEIFLNLSGPYWPGPFSNKNEKILQHFLTYNCCI